MKKFLQRVGEVVAFILAIAMILGFVSCCYMLDKFRWTL